MNAEIPQEDLEHVKAELTELKDFVPPEEKKKLTKDKLIRLGFYVTAFVILTLILNSGYIVGGLGGQIAFNAVMLFLAIVFFNLWNIIKFIKCKKTGIEFKDRQKDEPFKSILGVPIIFIIMTAVLIFISLMLVIFI